MSRHVNGGVFHVAATISAAYSVGSKLGDAVMWRQYDNVVLLQESVQWFGAGREGRVSVLVPGWVQSGVDIRDDSLHSAQVCASSMGPHHHGYPRLGSPVGYMNANVLRAHSFGVRPHSIRQVRQDSRLLPAWVWGALAAVCATKGTYTASDAWPPPRSNAPWQCTDCRGLPGCWCHMGRSSGTKVTRGSCSHSCTASSCYPCVHGALSAPMVSSPTLSPHHTLTNKQPTCLTPLPTVRTDERTKGNL